MDNNVVPQSFELKHPTSGMVSLTYIIYGLHLFSAINGVLTSAFIVTAFLTGWPSILAVILNYIKADEVEGTYLESHFRWQIKTFWYSLVALVIAAVLFVTLIGIPIAFGLLVITGIWVLYRMLRGILRMLDEKPLPMD